MKKTAIMQPYFFPYIGYWQLINSVDEFLVYDDVNFIKNGWINRNNILINSQKHIFTMPLDGASPFLPINQIKCTSNMKNKEKLMKTIELAYKKAPFFNEVIPLIYDTIFFPSDKIADKNYYSIKRLSEYMGIKTKFRLSSTLDKNDSLKGQDKVIHVCKLLDTDIYINAIGGLSLYNKEEFARHNIELYFLKTHEIKYKQYKNEFVPNLSIIDVLMFNDLEIIKNYLNEYTLI